MHLIHELIFPADSKQKTLEIEILPLFNKQNHVHQFLEKEQKPNLKLLFGPQQSVDFQVFEYKKY